MTVEYPLPSTAAPNYREAAANTSCPSAWAETSASFAGLRVTEVRELWIPMPLDQEPAKSAPVVLREDLGIVLASIAATDAVGNLRGALRPAFRILDQHMLEGRWIQLQMILLALLSAPYSMDLGVGALRFCSSARQRIPNWPKLTDAAKQRCEQDGADYRLVLRGLL